VLDFNLDGIEDIAVSMPGNGAESLRYYGKVAIYFGRKGTGIATGEKPDVIIEPENDPAIASVNFGSSLGTGDLNGDGHPDLLIGSPLMQTKLGFQVGSLFGFLSKSGRRAQQTLSPKDADLSLFGEGIFHWFGFSFKTYKNLLLVGAPAYNFNNQSTLGKLYGFNIENLKSPNLVFSITGSKVFGKLGHSFDVGCPLQKAPCSEPLLAVSMPTEEFLVEKDQAGKVAVFKLNALRQNSTVDDLDPVASFTNNFPFSRLGWKVKFGDLNGDSLDDLVLTQPWKDNPFDGAESSGNVFVFKGGRSFPNGKVTNPEGSCSVCFGASKTHALFGSNVHMLPKFNSTRMDLLVSAPTMTSSNDGSYESNGAVILIDGSNF